MPTSFSPSSLEESAPFTFFFAWPNVNRQHLGITNWHSAVANGDGRNKNSGHRRHHPGTPVFRCRQRRPAHLCLCLPPKDFTKNGRQLFGGQTFYNHHYAGRLTSGLLLALIVGRQINSMAHFGSERLVCIIFSALLPVVEHKMGQNSAALKLALPILATIFHPRLNPSLVFWKPWARKPEKMASISSHSNARLPFPLLVVQLLFVSAIFTTFGVRSASAGVHQQERQLTRAEEMPAAPFSQQQQQPAQEADAEEEEAEDSAVMAKRVPHPSSWRQPGRVRSFHALEMPDFSRRYNRFFDYAQRPLFVRYMRSFNANRK